MATSKYSKLFSPLQLRNGNSLINRAIMGSMHTGLEEGSGFWHGLEKMAGFFEERARGHVGLIVTGGIAPNSAGRVAPTAASMTTPSDAQRHHVVTDAVHGAGTGSKIAMQILHAGRYAYHPFGVAPTKLKAPIGWFTPKELSGRDVEATIDDFARASALAEEAGYDGVEIMGSEGYLINEFIASRTNRRTDEWGGAYSNRIKLPVRIVEEVRKAVRPDFIVMFRLSMLDLVDEGSEWPEVVALAQALEAAGADVINTGIGWHEARIPTIATSVPRAGFSWVTHKLRTEGGVGVPLVATNRINMPEVAEKVLADGHADLVSMARPFLADPFLLTKAMAEREEEINTCIACNQACLDHTFQARRASCLVNPRAGYETELHLEAPAATAERIAVVGGGPAGLAFSTTAARRGHDVTLFESSATVGGQFNLAKRVPGKAEFYETIRYFKKELALAGVDVKLETRATVDDLASFDKVVLATGVTPRPLSIPGEDHPKVMSYIDVLTGRRRAGRTVAVVGAGGIGFDVSEYLAHGDSAAGGADEPHHPQLDDFLKEWSIDGTNSTRGGLLPPAGAAAANGGGAPPPAREITLLQRKRGKHGAGLGKTTGWIHRASLKARHVTMLGGVSYVAVDDDGLHVKLKDGTPHVLDVESIVVCAGQTPLRELQAPLSALGVPVYLIGGAHEAGELDAKRAIDQGSRLAADIERAKPDRVGEYVAPLGMEGWLFQQITSRSKSA